MGVEGAYRIAAPRERVRRALTDEAALSACLPGCRSFERVADHTFAATLSARVDGGDATVNSRFVIIETEEPNVLSVRAECEAGPHGYARADMALTLTAEADATLIVWRGSLAVGGAIGAAGEEGAARLAGGFFRCLASRLEGGGPPLAPVVRVRRGPTAQQVIIVSGFVIYAIILVLLFLLPKGAGS